MKINILFLITILCLLESCSDKKSSSTENINEDPQNISGTKKISLNEEPAKTVINAIYWYHRNGDLLNTLDCAVTLPCPCYSSSDSSYHYDDTLAKYPYYSINFYITEQLLSTLQQSGYYSKIFLNNIREEYRRVDEKWKKHPVSSNDNPPNDFEDHDDLMAFPQMFTWDSLSILKSTVKKLKISDNTARLTLKLAQPNSDDHIATFSLTKYDNSWLIDSAKMGE